MHIIKQLIAWLFPPVCVVCGREGAWLCAPARSVIERLPIFTGMQIPGIDQVLARGSYDCVPLQALIQRMKYAGWRGLDEEFQSLLRPLVVALPVMADRVVIVPVPLHQGRQRDRGFNQAGYIALALSQLTGWPVRPILHRSRPTKIQAQLSASQRQSNVAGAFAYIEHSPIAKRMVLVDDVITTGSTIQACAAVLRQHGVAEIMAIALAKG